MNCEEMRPQITAYIDGELDATRAVALEQHLVACAECAALHRQQSALSKAVRTQATYHRAPETLRMRLRASLPQQVSAPVVQRRPRSAWMQWSGALAASLALAIGLNIFLSGRQADRQLEDELIAGHVRSLQANHLEDVISSDHHTVKPWFTGKLDFSPPVNDLSAVGFPLTGGRLDYIDGRAVAALIYRHGPHTINLFVWPSAPSGVQTPLRLETRKGYNLMHWTDRGMNFWAVTDMDAAQLKT
ncbi:MAG: anti-sigma factor family protein, partial [Stenotrophobium sp.]